jgi:hypothetical protein
MKHFLICALFFYALINSCSYSCSNATSTITLIGFTSRETDTIIVRKFSKATNFATIIDIFLVNKTNSSYYQKNDTLEISASYKTDNGLLSKYDYEIYVPYNNKLYQISEIKEDYKSINSGCKKVGCINSITSYKLNGQIIIGDKTRTTIIIPK